MPPTERHRRPSGLDRESPYWLGHIVEKGPGDEADWPDHRYWVEPLTMRPDNEEGAEEHSAAIMVPYELDVDGGRLNFDTIRTVTNMSEEWTRGHLLWLNQAILCMTLYDKFDVVKHVTFTPPPQPWMWVKIVAASVRPGPDNQWTYTGIRQGLNDEGRYIDGIDFYAREIEGIINPAEAHNNGGGLHGNSINVTQLEGCEIVEIRGFPVVAISPAVTVVNEENVGTVWWSVVSYPNSVDQI